MKSADLVELVALAREFPIFAGMPADVLAKILGLGFRQVASPGEYLTKLHDPADCFYLILKGQVQIRGKDHTPLALLGPGELLGEMGYLEDTGRRLAESIVIKAVTLLQLHYGALRRLFEREPAVQEVFLPSLQGLMSSRTPQEALGLVPPANPGAFDGAGPSVQATGLPVLVPSQIRAALARCSIFEGFDDPSLRLLADLGRPVRFEADTAVFEEGDSADSLYVAALGRFAVVAPGGGRSDILAQVVPGHCFGELPLALGLPIRTATVLAQTVASAVRISYAELERALRSDAAMHERFEENLARLAESRAARSPGSDS